MTSELNQQCLFWAYLAFIVYILAFDVFFNNIWLVDNLLFYQWLQHIWIVHLFTFPSRDVMHRKIHTYGVQTYAHEYFCWKSQSLRVISNQTNKIVMSFWILCMVLFQYHFFNLTTNIFNFKIKFTHRLGMFLKKFTLWIMWISKRLSTMSKKEGLIQHLFFLFHINEETIG